MSRSTLSIRYDGTEDQFILDVFFERGRAIRHNFTPGESLDVTDVCSADELSRDATFAALVAADTFAVVQTAGADIAGVMAGQLGVLDDGLAPLFVLRVVLTSGGAAGTADDVTVYDADAPFAFKILDAWALVVQTGASDGLLFRTEAAGAGTLLAGEIDCTNAGVNRAAGTTPTATTTVAEGGSLFVRRDDRSVTGEIFALCMRV